ncbi:MAG: hypothetical protein GY782_12080 [Gammaproteobacteria bacterium]|nr:hypothetical protein [Gammaproteobacteria bacterium]
MSTPAWAAVLYDFPSCHGYSMTLRSEGFGASNQIYYLMEATSPDNPDRYVAAAIKPLQMMTTYNALCQEVAKAQQKHKS